MSTLNLVFLFQRLSQLQPEVIALPEAFGWSQLLLALAVGLLTAFALQLLLTNLGLAIAISMVPVPVAEAAASDEEPDEASENLVAKLGTMAGLGILLTINTVLFAACFLAVKLTQTSNSISGATTGVVIWSAYLLLLLWLSSKALNSVIAPVLDIAIGGFRRLVSAIAAVGIEDKPMTEAQMTAIIQEVQASLSPTKLQEIVEEQVRLRVPATSPAWSRFTALPASCPPSDPGATELWQNIESYFSYTSRKKLTPKRVDRKLSKMLHNYLEVKNFPGAIACDRTVLAQLLEQRQDLSAKQRKQILRQFDKTWSGFEQQLTTQAAAVTEADTSVLPEPFNLLQDALPSTVNQVLNQLPEHWQQLNLTRSQWLELASLILPVVAKYIRENAAATDIDALELEAADSENLEDLDDLEKDESGLIQLSQSLMAQAKNLQHQLTEQIASIQQEAQDQVDTLKQQTQARIAATRKAAAAAAWWLFLIATTSAVSAATAGMIATGFNPMRLLILLK